MGLAEPFSGLSSRGSVTREDGDGEGDRGSFGADGAGSGAISCGPAGMRAVFMCPGGATGREARSEGESEDVTRYRL